MDAYNILGLSSFTLLDFLLIIEYALIIHCRWSCDGRYFARMTADTLSVYETPVSNLIMCVNILIQVISVDDLGLMVFIVYMYVT